MQPNPGQAPPQYQQPPQPYPQQAQYQQQQQQMLTDVVNGAQEVLYEANTVFPFTLFTDSIVIDREKLTITHRSFFKTADVTSVHIDDLLNISANVGPFFGSIKIVIRYSNDPQTVVEVHYLTRRDALSIQRIAQGYSIARQQGVDCAALPKARLVEMLLNLGSGLTPGTQSP